MASIHKQPNRPFWFGSFTGADGRRHLKSTKTKNRSQALVICRKWELTAKKAKRGNLTPDAAREVIAQGVAEIFATGGDELPSATTRQWAHRWLESKSLESAPATLARYRGTIEKFLVYLCKTADRHIEHVTSSHVEGFRNQEAKNLSSSSANIALKVIRALFSGAVAKQLILRNPASASYVKTIENRGSAKRRAFTLGEIKRILAKTEEKSEWRGMILMGIYTGQRLGDLARMTWRSIDFDSDHLAFTTGKTGRRIILPLAKPLRSYLEVAPSADDPDSPIFPEASKAKTIGHLSNGFRSILEEAGLAKARKPNHAGTGKGRTTKREVSELSFHSLRHSAVTFLKAAGATDVLAREIVGHDSAAVSRSYTHLATEDLRPAIDKLPDVTV
jgi:integrase